MNLTKELLDLHTENYKTLLKKTKDVLNKCKNIQSYNTVKVATLFKLVYK